MKSIKKVLALALALAMVVTAVPVTSAEAATTGVPKTKTYYAGKTYTLKLTTPKSWKSVKSTWSEKSSAVSLSSKKAKSVKVKAIKAGSATVKVKVTYKKSSKKNAKKYTKTYSCKVTVKNSSISAPKTATVEARDTAALKVTARPSTAKITYTSDNTAVATVDDKGVVTGVAEGTATITSAITCGTVKKSAETTVTVTPAVAKVTGVVATNATTITLSGKNLDKLTINDVKVEGYTASTIKASEDTLTATIALGSALVPDKDTKVTITIGGVATDYTVKYSVNAAAVSVKDRTYGTGATNQYLSIQANGTDTTVDELEANGYTVTFYAYQEDNNGALQQNNDLLDGGTYSNTSGKIKDSLTTTEVGTYKVKVVLTKGTTTITSEYATIKVTDKKNFATGIVSAKLTANASGADVAVYDVKETSFDVQRDDVLTLNDLKVSTSYGVDSSVNNDLHDLSKVIITSDNTQVATVANQKITAQKPGTAKITFTYGSLTKEVTLNVKTDGRSFSTVKIDSSVATILDGSQQTKAVYAVDNYGAYRIGQYIYVELADNSGAVVSNQFDVEATKPASFPTITNTSHKAVQTGNEGCVYLEFVASSYAGAKSTFKFYKGATNNAKEGSLLNTYNVTVAGKTGTNYKLEIAKSVGYSADASIDYNPLVGDDKIKLDFNRYYGSVKDGAVAFSTVSGMTISYDASIVTVKANGTVVTNGAIVAPVLSEKALEITPTGKAGSTTITLRNNTQGVEASFTVTTANTVPTLKDIGLRTDKINADVVNSVDYRDLFQVVTNKANPELPGAVLANNTKGYSTVKLATDTTVTAWKKNASGVWASTNLVDGDVYVETADGNLCLGTLEMKLTVGGLYQKVTTSLAISQNQANSLIFAVIDANNKVVNTLDSAISVNSYK